MTIEVADGGIRFLYSMRNEMDICANFCKRIPVCGSSVRWPIQAGSLFRRIIGLYSTDSVGDKPLEIILSLTQNPAQHGQMKNGDNVKTKVSAEDLASKTAEELLPLVYEELRDIARWRMSRERPGHTLQATALVHEAYQRVSGGDEEKEWGNRRHFFAAASEAMRRILIENARRKNAAKRGGKSDHTALAESRIAAPSPPEELLAIDAALGKLTESDPQSAELVKLRFFVGLTQTECADVLGISRRDADRIWAFAKIWLRTEMEKE